MNLITNKEMNTLKLERKRADLPKWSPFNEHSIWKRVKTSYTFVWKNKYSLGCVAIPATAIRMSNAENTGLDLLSLLFICLGYVLVLTTCKLQEEMGDGSLSHVGFKKWAKRFGYIFLTQLLYFFVVGLILILLGTILTFIAVPIYMALPPATGNIWSHYLPIFAALFPIFCIGCVLCIIINMASVKLSLHNGDNLMAYSRKMMKGNWWSTIGYFTINWISYLIIILVGAIPASLVYAIIAAVTGNADNGETIMKIMLLPFGAFIIAHSNCVAYVYQFMHLHRKYEEKLAAENENATGSNTENPEAT